MNNAEKLGTACTCTTDTVRCSSPSVYITVELVLGYMHYGILVNVNQMPVCFDDSNSMPKRHKMQHIWHLSMQVIHRLWTPTNGDAITAAMEEE
jgi:hypothetical protein